MSDLRGLVAGRVKGNKPPQYGSPVGLAVLGLGTLATIAVMSKPAVQEPSTEGEAWKVAHAAAPVRTPKCGDGRCDPAESMASCMADCPGVTTPATCGEERSCVMSVGETALLLASSLV